MIIANKNDAVHCASVQCAVKYYHSSFFSLLFSQEARKMVDFVLRHGNDLLAVESLKGFEVR